jgi:hypothetical protein
VPAQDASRSGSLRALAAPGAAFLGISGYLNSPAASRAPTPAPKDKAHPWEQLDSDDGGEGFWITRAMRGQRVDSPALPESDIGTSAHTRPQTPEKAAVPLSPRLQRTPSRHLRTPSPLPGRTPSPARHDSASIQITPPRMKKLPTPAWRQRDEVDALGDVSAPSTPSHSRASSQTRPNASPGRLGGVLQHLHERRQRRADEDRIDPFFSPKPGREELPDETGRAV